LTILIAATTWWHHPARLARAFTKAGARVAVLCPKGSSALTCRVSEQAFEYRPLHPLDSLERAIRAAKPDFIVAVDDPVVDHLHELYHQAAGQGPGGTQIRELIARSLGDPDYFEAARSRFKLLSLAREEGVLVPDSAEIQDAADLGRWGENQEFPWVLKMDGNSSGLGVRVVETMAEAQQGRRMLARQPSFVYVAKRLLVNHDLYPARPWLRRQRPAVSVQAFIRGTPANISVAAWQGEVVASFSVVVCQTLKRNGPASVVRLVDNPAMRAAAERLARRLNLTGFFGLDFMIAEGSGDAYLIELNPRVTQLCHLKLGPGRDLTSALYEKLSGVPADRTPSRITSDRIVIFPNAWMGNLGDEIIASGYHDVPWDDPELLDQMLKPIWCNRGLVFSAVEWFRSLGRDGGTGPAKAHRRELRRPAYSESLPAMNSAKSDGSI
jgi:hypothetical protein